MTLGFAAAIGQILMLDLVFSIDSIITAVGMTEHLPIMIIAVVVSVLVMLLAAEPLAKFINDNPTVVMLALGFLIMIGMTLIAEGFGAHVPERLRVRSHGVLGGDRDVEHDVPPRPAEAGLRGSLIGAERNGRLPLERVQAAVFL